jgi:cytochrome P450
MTASFVYDPARPDFQDQAYPIYRVLRDRFPVHHSEQAGFWALSRFEDVRAAANDPETFSSEGTDTSQGLLPMIQALDPPRHDLLRQLVSKAFTPRRVSELEPGIRRIARRLIDGFARDGETDLMASFARHLPSLVFGELLGVPQDRREKFLDWTHALVEAKPGPGSAESRRHPALKIYQEFSKLIAERRERRGDDLMSALLDAEIDGERLSDPEILGFCYQLIVAGNDTTTTLIGNGAVLLAEHPDQRAALARDPGRIPGAVEEMLRYESPAQALPRRARVDFELHGRRIPADARVLLVFGAANRDEREFEDPDRFDVRRTIRRHLALGHGVHSCLGASLARLEARVAFEELLARIPEWTLESKPGWITSRWARAHDAVPIAFDPRRLAAASA